jgi:hypothetical protein
LDEEPDETPDEHDESGKSNISMQFFPPSEERLIVLLWIHFSPVELGREQSKCALSDSTASFS